MKTSDSRHRLLRANMPVGIVRVRRRPSEWDEDDDTSSAICVKMLGAEDSSLSRALSAVLTPSRSIVTMKGSRDDPFVLIPTKSHPSTNIAPSSTRDRNNSDDDRDVTPPYYGLPAFQLFCNLEISSASPPTPTSTPSLPVSIIISDTASLPSILQRALMTKRHGGGGFVRSPSCAVHGPFGCHCVILKSIGKAVCAMRAEFRLPSTTAAMRMMEEKGTPRFTNYDVPFSNNTQLYSEVAMMVKSSVVPSVDFANRVLDIAAGCSAVGYGGTVLFFPASKPSSGVVALIVVGCSAELPLPPTRRLLGPFILGPNENRGHILSSLNVTLTTMCGKYTSEAVASDDDVPLKVPQCVSCSARGVVSLVQCVGCKEYLCRPPTDTATALSSYPSDYQPTPIKQHKIPSAWIRLTPPSVEATSPTPTPTPTPTPISAPTTSCGRQCLYCPSGALCCQRCIGVEYSTAHYQRVYVCNQAGCQAQHREMERLAECNH